MHADFTKPSPIGIAELLQAGSLDPYELLDQADFFPCYPEALSYRTERDPLTGERQIVPTGLTPSLGPWSWAVCHAGSWIHRRHRYCWVAGHKRHHMAPVRWVKSGRSVGFVPIHPYDVKGRPPINRTEDVLVVTNKNGLSVERVKFGGDSPIEELKSPPREFRRSYLQPLSRADAPRMEAHLIEDGSRRGNAGAVKAAAVALKFDFKSRGTLQARGDNYAGGHGGSNDGGSARGGATSGGGASHSGGSGASPSGSSASSANSSAASSGGGSSHR